MESTHNLQVDGVLIARHGKLVLEEYFHAEHRDKPHETRSASKSMTATLVGAAMQAGAPLRLSTPVYQIMNGGSFRSQSRSAQAHDDARPPPVHVVGLLLRRLGREGTGT